MFWLDRGKLRVCPRGFEYFEEWQIQILENEEKELRTREKLLEVEVEWASRGVKARRKRNVRRLDQMKEERGKAARRPGRVQQDDGEDRDAAGRYGAARFRASWSRSCSRSARPSRPMTDGRRQSSEDFSFRLIRGDRIGVLGKNGSGKTTFLSLLIRELQPDAGTVKVARSIEISYFDQKRRDLNPKDSLWKTLSPNGDHVDVRGKQRHVISYLKDFMFDPSDVHRPVQSFSGGQKNRLMLAKILANPKSLPHPRRTRPTTSTWIRSTCWRIS